MKLQAKIQGAILCSVMLWSAGAAAKDHDHHHHGKHAHGEGRMDVAFEGLKGEIDFKISGDAILGSENAPKGAKAKQEEKAKLSELAAKFRESVKFTAATCVWGRVEAEVDRHKVGKVEHAEVEIEADITCDKPVKGGALTIDLRRHYPGVNKIEVQVVAPDLQKGGVIDAETRSLDLN